VTSSNAVPFHRPSRPRDAGGDWSFLTITVEHLGRTLVLAVAGEIDLDTSPSLESALQQAAAAKPPAMVVDLSAVRFLACAGLSVLVVAQQKARGHTCLRVVAGNRATSRPLRLTGVDEYLSVYSSRGAALAEPLPADGVPCAEEVSVRR
jgi:anti-anti-sigma factor